MSTASTSRAAPTARHDAPQAQGLRTRRRSRSNIGPFWLVRGFLIATVALAFSTLERTELWPNRSRLVATFKAPSFLVQKVQVGSKLPAVELILPSPEGASPGSSINTQDLFEGKHVILLSTPMAFSPGCSNIHIPGYIQAEDKLRARGIDLIAVVSMDTPFAMHAWGRQLGAGQSFLFLSDVQGQLVKSLGTTFEAGSLGLRPTRFAMAIEDMKITKWEVEEEGGLSCSLADHFLDDL